MEWAAYEAYAKRVWPVSHREKSFRIRCSRGEPGREGEDRGKAVIPLSVLPRELACWPGVLSFLLWFTYQEFILPSHSLEYFAFPLHFLSTVLKLSKTTDVFPDISRPPGDVMYTVCWEPSVRQSLPYITTAFWSWSFALSTCWPRMFSGNLCLH